MRPGGVAGDEPERYQPLRLLKVSRIVKCRKQGRVVYYSLDDAHIGQIFAMAFDHVMEEREG